jgi:dolichyl-phosphate-mannose-protein mannosyltransferase
VTDQVLDAPAPVRTGSRLDDWWSRLISTPGRARAWFWGGPLAVTLLAAILRLVNLGHPHAIVFDETFYVKDAWSLWNNGYESTWDSKANEQFVAGKTDGFTRDGTYVVHPPLGKWLIALGMFAFGPANAFGWRFTVAVAGIVAVWLIVLITRRLTGSTLLGVIAGGLMAIEGSAIVMSRVSVLDNILMVLTLTGFYLMILDRVWARRRIDAWVAARNDSGREFAWGPTLWWRPWLILAAVLFGASSGVKWSGLWFLAVFGLFVIVMDAVDRRRAGIPLWFSAAILKQGPAAFVLMVPIALATYVSTWTGWIVTSGGYMRDLIEKHPDQAATGFWAWTPTWLQDLWAYHLNAYGFHVGMSTPHPYQANPLTWLFMIRPTSMYYLGSGPGENGCSFYACSEAVTPIANPLIWFAAVAALGYLVYRFIRLRQWQVGIVLLGMVAGYLPWLAYTNRTVFSFYSIIFEPYMMIALAMTIGVILGTKNDPTERREGGIRLVLVFGILAIVLSAFFYPIWTGMQVPLWFWQMHMWLPSWV